MFLVCANHDLDVRVRVLQRVLVFFFERTKSFDAVTEMDGIDAKLGQSLDAPKQFIRAGERGAAGAVDHAHQIEGLVRGIFRKRTFSFSEVCETAR